MSGNTTEALPGPADGSPAKGLCTVYLRNAPLRLWARASAHTADLLREFSLLSFAPASTASPLPARFLEVLGQLQVRYADVSNKRTVELEDALCAGLLSKDWRYDVPRQTAADIARLTALLDEADIFCAQGNGVMTLPTPPDQRAFRRWFESEFRGQIEQGAEPVPWDGPLT